jgi:hypothetical protein
VTPTEAILLMCIPYMGLLMLATGLFTAWSSVNRHLIRQGLAEQLPKEVRWKSRDEIADEVIAERAKQRQEVFSEQWVKAMNAELEKCKKCYAVNIDPVIAANPYERACACDRVDRWSEQND